MFCPKCGAQLPDGTQFCSECGASTEAEPQGTVQSVPQPTQSFAAPTQQPMQPTYPQGGQQPGYAEPVYGQTAVKKKPPVVPIIIGVCSAALVAFLIVLFTVIIPNNSGVKGKLRHKWSYSADAMGMTVSMTYDFKNNKVDMMGMSMDIDWKVTGDDTLSITMSAFGQTETVDMKFKLSSDNKTLTLSPIDGSEDPVTLTRAD